MSPFDNLKRSSTVECPPSPPRMVETDAMRLPTRARTHGCQSKRSFDDVLKELAEVHHHEVDSLKRRLEAASVLQSVSVAPGEPKPAFTAPAHPKAKVMAPVEPIPELPHACPDSPTSTGKGDDSDKDSAFSKRESPKSTTIQEVGRQMSRQMTHGSSSRNNGFELLDTWEEIELDEDDSPRGIQSRRYSGELSDKDVVSRNQLRLLAAIAKGESDSITMSAALRPSVVEEVSMKEKFKCNDLFRPAVPTSPTRLAWDIIGAMLIFYDLILLPMEPFHIPRTDFLEGMDWFILFFWTVNVLASLTVGFVEHGVVVMSYRRIAFRYVKTWMWVDVMVLVPDWTFTFAEMGMDDNKTGAGDGVRLLRVLRLLRMARLLRLLKLRRIFDTFNDLIDSEYVSVLANLAQMILFLLVVNHLIGCVWFGIGSTQYHSWIKVHLFEHRDWPYQYFTSFHWSITQFTPASMDVQPQNLGERLFCIVVVVFGLVGFSYMVGSITGSLGQLRNMHAEETKLFWDLKTYLKCNKVNRALSVRIQKYLEHAWQATQERKPAKSVKLMDLLSEQLVSELKFELAVPQMKIHPFLARLIDRSTVTMHRLANEAVGHKLLASKDCLFHPGEAATHLYIVVEGRFTYLRFDTTGELHKEIVDKGEDWIAEPVFWTKRWVHKGLLKAVEAGDNLTINAAKFGDIVKLNPQAHQFASGYAQNYVVWLNNQDANDLSDISQGEMIGDRIRGFIPSTSFHQKDDPLLPRRGQRSTRFGRMASSIFAGGVTGSLASVA